MTARGLAAVLIKLFGLYLLVTLLLSIPAGVQMGIVTLAEARPQFGISFVVAPFLLKAAVAVGLLMGGDALVRRLFPTGSPATGGLGAEELAAVMTAVLGLGFLVHGLGILLAQGISLLLLGEILRSYPGYGDPPPSWPAALLPGFLNVALGIVLFLASGRIARAWYRRRPR